MVMDPDPAANVARIVEASYGELRAIAARAVAAEPAGRSIQPTALVHEAFLRLAGQTAVGAEGSTFLKRCFAQEYRRILVDSARSRRALRHGGGARVETLIESAAELGRPQGTDVVALDDALSRLAHLNERMGEIAQMRLFAGMTVAECAQALRIAVRTIEKDWTFARSWLRKELADA